MSSRHGSSWRSCSWAGSTSSALAAGSRPRSSRSRPGIVILAAAVRAVCGSRAGRSQALPRRGHQAMPAAPHRAGQPPAAPAVGQSLAARGRPAAADTPAADALAAAIDAAFSGAPRDARRRPGPGHRGTLRHDRRLPRLALPAAASRARDRRRCRSRPLAAGGPPRPSSAIMRRFVSAAWLRRHGKLPPAE